MEFGLPPTELQLIRSVFQEFPSISAVTVFGSRAMGNFKPGSDVDLSVEGDLTHEMLAALRGRLNDELPLPYEFDVFDHSKITSQDLLDHISQHGRPLYTK